MFKKFKMQCFLKIYIYVSIHHHCFFFNAYFKINAIYYQLTNVSDGAINPVGGNPVCGSVPLGLLKRRICGSGLCN
jgi:hypothetical protein